MTSVTNREPIFDSVTNKHYESDLRHALRHTRMLFTFLGIWTDCAPTTTRIERYLSKFVKPVCMFFMFWMVVPSWCFFALLETRMEIHEFIMLIGPLSHATLEIVQYLYLYVHMDLIRHCVHHMQTDWQSIEHENEREIAIRNEKFGNRLSIGFTICMYSSGACYGIILPLVTPSYLNERNETVRPINFPGIEIFINMESERNFAIGLSSNCIASFFHFTLITTIFNLASIFVNHSCGQIQIIISRLNSLVEASDSVDFENRIAFIVRSHVRVLSFSTRIDKVLQEIFLIEVVSSTILICLFEYCIISEWGSSDVVGLTSYLSLFVTFCINMYIYCYIGERLKEQCHEVGRAAYMIDWYKLPGKSGLDLVMIISMSSIPCKLTAGYIIELSITTFCTVMRTSFAYLGMIRQVTEV